MRSRWRWICRLVAQAAHVPFQLLQIGVAADGSEGCRQGRLHADLELEGLRRHGRQQGERFLVEEVGADLEMEVAFAVVREDELPDGAAARAVVVEGAVDEFDLRRLRRRGGSSGRP